MQIRNAGFSYEIFISVNILIEFESGISHNDPGALQDHCVIL